MTRNAAETAVPPYIFLHSLLTVLLTGTVRAALAIIRSKWEVDVYYLVLDAATLPECLCALPDSNIIYCCCLSSRVIEMTSHFKTTAGLLGLGRWILIGCVFV
ncbi:hypothetical protein F4780DRAFT_726378 [Xylariomycetidae sp. FL0641]|nr:hypothetical protein F4780DRAFT_726378 [Xylariomycetidae sp. FL0641]